MRLYPAFSDCAESALLADFGPQYGKDLSLAILDLCELLMASALPGLKESIPALSTLTLFYDPLLLPRERIVREVQRLCETCGAAPDRGRTWDIPVVYGGQSGADLGDVARLAGLTEEETVALHTGSVYHVYMLGFLPGFAYLGDLPEKLKLPRRATPRARVPAGSVAIAADMTAIYPLESPGGWHLIGRTPFLPWEMNRRQEPLLRPGDRVRFKRVSAAEAGEWRERAGAGPGLDAEAPA
jgi:KipI family sensor histidine kinase inhibitor